MIIVFPMLTDEDVSQNVLPGICKALEKFILIYELDAIMKMTGWQVVAIGGKIASQIATAGAVAAKTKRESDNLLEYGPGNKNWESRRGEEEFDDEGNEIPREEIRSNRRDTERGSREKEKTPGELVFDTMHGIKDIGSVKVEMPKDQALSVEPTYITVTTTLGTRIIGIKVIPCPVKSQRYTMAELLTADASLNFINTQVYRISRKVIRGFWALCRSLRVPFLSDKVISGDPEKDILWAQSFHRKYVFCLINYADMSSEFFKNIGGIHKLHQVGWNSIIAADDVNKRALFCMKEFHGLCTTVPYQFIYSSLGKDHGKVYDSLEEVKKSASPFLQRAVSIKRLFD